MYLGNTLDQETASGELIYYHVLVLSERKLFWGWYLSLLSADDAAVGFKLDSFLRLSDTLAPNSNMSLMHYLCKVKL